MNVRFDPDVPSAPTRVQLRLGVWLSPLALEHGGATLRHALAAAIPTDAPPAAPTIDLRHAAELEGQRYALLVDGRRLAEGTLHAERLFLAADAAARAGVTGVTGVDPRTGAPGVWLTPEAAEVARAAGEPPESPVAILASHLAAALDNPAPITTARLSSTRPLDAVRARLEVLRGRSRRRVETPEHDAR